MARPDRIASFIRGVAAEASAAPLNHSIHLNRLNRLNRLNGPTRSTRPTRACSVEERLPA